MAELILPLYEGLFLLAQSAVADLNAANAHLEEIFNRAGAQVLVLRRWDERKLAYPIQGQKRGTYILAYFRARGAQIANIERDCTLSELILRSLIIRADHLGDIEVELQAKEVTLSQEAKMRNEPAPAKEAAPAKEQAAPAAEEAADEESAAPASESAE